MARKILIAEDEEFIAKLYKFELEQHSGVEVTVVLNGRQAIEAVKKDKYHLVLLDLLMPDMDGFSVLAELKKNNVGIPVTVVLTNLGQDVDRKKCRKLGAEDYLVKSDTGAGDLWEKVKKYVPVE